MMSLLDTPSIGTRLIAFIEKQLKRFTSNLETASHTGDVEAVHDLRVASRRLTEPLRTLGPAIGLRRSSRVIATLKRTRGAYRSVRDLDVVYGSLWDPSCTHRLDDNDKSRLEDMLSRRRERAARRTAMKTERIKPMNAVQKIEAAIGRAPDSMESLPESVICDEVRAVVRAYRDKLMHMDPRTSEGTHLHDARLCVKRMRYAAELLRELDGGIENDLIACLTEMQELLGKWNDHLMAAARISALARRPKLLASASPFAARLLEYAAARAQAAVNQRQLIVEKWPLLEQALRKPDQSVCASARIESLEAVGSGPA